MFCTGCCASPSHKQDDDSDDCPLRLLRGSPALVQAICAFCLPTIRDSDSDKDAARNIYGDSDSDNDSDSDSDDDDDDNDDDDKAEHE